MIKIRDLVQQLNLESFIALQRKFSNENNTLLRDCLLLFRNELFSEEKMAELLSLNNSLFFDIKQNLRREIYDLLNINQEEQKSKLLFKMLFLSSRPSNFFSSEENFVLINLLQDLINNKLEYEASPLFEKLAQLNRNSESYEEYYNLFRTHFNIRQSTQRCLSLFMHLNGKLGEYNEEPCIEYIKQIDRTFLEIKNIHTFNENNLTVCIRNASLLLISIFCSDSKYAFTRTTSLLSTLVMTNEQINNLPESIERFYLEQILFFCAVKLNQDNITNDASQYLISKLTSQKIKSVHYNFNFPKDLAKQLLSLNAEERSGAVIIDIKKHRMESNNVVNRSTYYTAKNLYKTSAHN